MQFMVKAFVNVSPNNFCGYETGQRLASVGRFPIKADDAFGAAEAAFAVGNRMGCALNGWEWPADVRSLSVGDVLRIDTSSCFDDPEGRVQWFTRNRAGWVGINPPHVLVPLVGINATSRSGTRRT